ncbi:MAG: metallophosphatase family protein [Dehalococcoidia bacterium]|nr:metallophosphatase family protein [Dehalococcoidia bacterium]
MRIAVISDTHLPSLIRDPDGLGPHLAAFLTGADLILHGGDVTRPSVLEWCEQFAPVLVAQGNNDEFEDRRMAPRQFLDVHGWRIGMVHELRPEDRPVDVLLDDALAGERVHILIGGDTHVERLEHRDGVVVLNPGSPTLPHHREYRLGAAAMLEVTAAGLRAEVVALGETPGMRNPTQPRSLALPPPPPLGRFQGPREAAG